MWCKKDGVRIGYEACGVCNDEAAASEDESLFPLPSEAWSISSSAHHLRCTGGRRQPPGANAGILSGRGEWWEENMAAV